MPYRKIIDNLRGKKCLSLSNRNIGDDDVKFLAQALIGTEITELDLSNNNIGCNGLKHLTLVLQDTQIMNLKLRKNNITNESIKFLTEFLKYTQITKLDLSENIIGIDAARYLNKMLSNTKIESLFLDIYYAEDNLNKYILQRSFSNIKFTHITLSNNKIGIRAAQYLNKTFENNAIASLTLNRKDLETDDSLYLAQAFKNIKICQLKIFYNHIMQFHGIKYLIQAFKDSQIATLNVSGECIKPTNILFLSEFFKQVKVLDLDLSQNEIGDEGMKYLAQAILNSDIMYINLTSNNIKAKGVRYLSEILQNSKILSINLSYNSIGNDGAKHLADILPYSQVTSLNLRGNIIEYAGYQYFMDIINYSNISEIYISNNNIALQEETVLRPYGIPGYINSTMYNIRKAFKELVVLNPMSNEFEFIVPDKDTYPCIDVNDYASLFRILKNNPNSKGHIFDMKCREDLYYDLDMMNNINKFIATMQDKFNTFINSKLPDLIALFNGYNYVNLVRQFEYMDMHSIVQNLLLHRVLYYVDEDQEILDPYIYKMLYKYGMTLFNLHIEPTKIEKIISYYRSHPRIDGAQEIIDMLESESFSYY